MIRSIGFALWLTTAVVELSLFARSWARRWRARTTWRTNAVLAVLVTLNAVGNVMWVQRFVLLAVVMYGVSVTAISYLAYTGWVRDCDIDEQRRLMRERYRMHDDQGMR